MSQLAVNNMEPFRAENEKEENGESLTERETGEGKLNAFFLKFTEDTSLHGVKLAFDHSKSRHFRVIWCCLSLLAVCVLLMMLYDSFYAYMEYKFRTVVMLTPTDQLPFPAVTICNLNGLELSKLRAQDTPEVSVSKAISVLSLMTSVFNNYVNDTTGMMGHNFPPELLNRTFQDVTWQAFADLNSTFITCFWNGLEENCDDMLLPLDLDMRRCFQFNGEMSARRRVSYTSGITSGLQVLVNIRQHEYLYNEIFAAGAQVILHEPGEMPDISNKGFLVSPGSIVFGRTSVTKYIYLSEPFKAFGDQACIDDVPVATEALHSGRVLQYTSALCRSMCVDAHAQSACHCRLSEASVYPNVSRRSKSTQCRCPRRCRRTEYEVTMSSAYYPSDVARDFLHDVGLVSKAQARKDFFSLKIFFDDLVSNEVKHEPQYTPENVIGTVGGQMGLFLGASLLSLAEVLYLMLTVCRRGLCALWSRLPHHSTHRAKR